MAIERARVRAVTKPWGRENLRPWSEARCETGAVGELWYEHGGDGAPDPALLFKLLLTTAPLSIQVHPDDAFAQAQGLARGKTEAWYVLAAEPEAQVAVGLTHRISASQLRRAIADGSIADLVRWHRVAKGDVVSIPPGTIHAIGAGLVIAEIQQNSDTTYRIFDYGRARALDVDNAVAVADAGPARFEDAPRQHTGARTILVACPPFVFESASLPPNSRWNLCPKHEICLFAATGSARVGSLELSVGDVVFASDERIPIVAGAPGFEALISYPGPVPVPHLLVAMPAASPAPPQHAPVPSPANPEPEIHP